MTEPEQEYEVYAGPPQPTSVRKFVCHEVCPKCGAPRKERPAVDVASTRYYFQCGTWIQRSGNPKQSDTCELRELRRRMRKVIEELESRASMVKYETPGARHLYFKVEGYRESARLLKAVLDYDE